MTEHWEKSKVFGRGAEDKYAVEIILHKRGEDVLGMAMRRNPLMPGCNWFEIQTTDAFLIERIKEETQQRNIPRDAGGDEWEW